MRLHILIYTLEGLREFSTVMQTLDFFSGLHNHLELSLVFISGYVNTENVFYCLSSAASQKVLGYDPSQK